MSETCQPIVFISPGMIHPTLRVGPMEISQPFKLATTDMVNDGYDG